MITTEQDARTKWCPYVRAQGGGGNRTAAARTLVPPNSNCLASDCMAWIWITSPQPGVERKGCCGMAHTRQGQVWD